MSNLNMINSKAKHHLYLSIIVLAAFVFLGSEPVLASLIWVNKDFRNTTGENRNDLTWFIQGHIKDAIVDSYTGTPFSGSPQVDELGPAPTTEVKWSGGNVSSGGEVHVGLLIDKDKLPDPFRFRRSSFWTLDGILKEQVPGSGVVDLVGDPEIHILSPTDPGDPSLYFFDFSYAVVSNPFQLSELTWDNPLIPWISVPGSTTLAPNGDFLAATIPADPGNYVIWQMAVTFAGDPVDSAGHIIMQQQKVPEPSTIVLILIGILSFRFLPIRSSFQYFRVT